MQISFCAAGCLPVDGLSLEERPVGGIETALIYLASYLHAAGHEVKVFTPIKTPRPTLPAYFPLSEIKSHSRPDIMVLVKDWRPVLNGIQGKRTFYWTGDGYNQYINFGFADKRVQQHLDLFLAVSEWHARTMCDASGFPRDKTAVLPNGIFLPFFQGEEPRTVTRLMYASAPNRGLHLAPHLMRNIRKAVPSAELHVYSGFSVYDTEKPYEGVEVGPFRSLVQRLSREPGITLKGNVRQYQLARAFMQAGFLLYPNTMFETSCIVALEAMAAGCPVICSNNSGIAETVQEGGVLISGEPGSPEYCTQTIEAVVTLLTNPHLREEVSDKAKARASLRGWESIALHFERLIQQVF